MSEADIDLRRSPFARAIAAPGVAGGLVWWPWPVNPGALRALGWVVMISLALATLYVGTRPYHPIPPTQSGIPAETAGDRGASTPATARTMLPGSGESSSATTPAIAPNPAGAMPAAAIPAAAPLETPVDRAAGAAERGRHLAVRKQLRATRTEANGLPLPLAASPTNAMGLPERPGTTDASAPAASLSAPATLTPGADVTTLIAGLANSAPIDPAPPGASDQTPVEIQVRQTGKSKNQGLLKGITGPGAAVTTRLDGGTALGLEAGTMKVGSNFRNYDLSSISTSVLGLTAHLELAADELNGAATLFNLRQKIGGGFGASVIHMENSHFESVQTGQGNSIARDFTELGVDGKLGWAALGVGVRRSTPLKGGTVEALRGWQWVPLGGDLSLTHSAVIPTSGNSLRSTQGSLGLDGNAGPLFYSLEFDYGDGTRLRPTAYSIALEGSPVPSLYLSSSLYYSGWDHSVSAGIGLVKRAGDFMIGPTVTMDTRGHGQAMLRIWLPLGNGGAPHRWLYQGRPARPISAMSAGPTIGASGK